MTQRERLERLRADVSRLLALMEHYDIAGNFKRNWAVLDRHADNFEIQIDRVKDSLAEAEDL